MARQKRPSRGRTNQAVAVSSNPETVAMGGGYEAARKLGQEMAGWLARNNSADRDILPVKDRIDARAVDIVRNDAYVEGGIEKTKNAVVGARLLLSSDPKIDYLSLQDSRFDSKWAEEFQTEIETKWDLYAESESRWVDAQRSKTASEIVRLNLGSLMIQGEALISSEWIRRQARRPYKTAFLSLDPFRVGDPQAGNSTETVGKNIRKGVRLNQYGEAIGYFIANEHPHDYYPSIRNDMTGAMYQYVPKETPWGRTNILLMQEERRVAQTRGVSRMAAALKEMKMTKNFRDVMLQNAIVNATYAAAIESDLPTKEVLEMLGGGENATMDQFEGAISGYTGGYLAALAAYIENSNGTTLNGVKIPHLFPGTKMTLQPAAQGGPLGTDFEKSLLRYLAASMNMSFEQFSGDMSDVNYSTLKGAINETEKSIRVIKRNAADRMMNMMYRNFMEELFANDEIESMPRGHQVFFWDRMNRDAYCSAQWFNSGRGQIDELKETQAAGLRLKFGISTLEAEAGRFGMDYRQLMRQRKREEEFAKRLGLTLGYNDPSLNAASGAPRDKTQDE